MCGNLLASMLAINGIESGVLAAVGGVKSAAILAALLGMIFLLPNLWQFRIKASLPLAAALSVAFVICVLKFDSDSPFLYFQF